MIRIPPQLIAIAALLLALVSGCGGGDTVTVTSTAQTSTRSVTTTPKPTFKATLRAVSHQPIVDRPWQVTIVVTSLSGQPAAATLTMNVLTHGFGTYPVDEGKVYRFVGRHRQNITWPLAAVGHPLTLQAVVTVKGKTQKLTWNVNVKR